MIPHRGSVTTRPSLLRRLRSAPLDQSAWAQFVARYGPLVYGWARRHRLQNADAEDVTQTVLLKVARSMPGFDYDPARSFRAWLYTLTRHARVNLLERSARDGEVAGLLQSANAWNDLAAQIDRIHERDVLREAMRRVKSRVDPKVWDAFRMTAIDELPSADVAARLGMQIANVYRARSTVQDMIRREGRAIDAKGDAP